MKKIKTLKIRIKDNNSHYLSQMAKSVNFVWNYVNELSSRSILEKGVFLSAYDIQLYTKGSSKDLEVNSATVQMIGAEYITRRNQFKKAKLNWRKTKGSRRSLGWIPFRGDTVQWKHGQIVHNGHYFKVWDSYGMSQYKFRSGCFTEDSRGRWYFCVAVEVEIQPTKGKSSIGIDLGCKEAAVCSNGMKLVGRRYRELEEKLGVAQRSNNKKRVKAIHAKIKNRRNDDLHKFSRKLANENAAIFVGNVSSLGLAKTKMAKSVLDASWGRLKTLLEYKCENAGGVFEVINEAYTTQTCSSCGEIPHSSPKGRIGLRIREWTCGECGVTHDRDINAAMNILAAGHRRLAEGIIAPLGR